MKVPAELPFQYSDPSRIEQSTIATITLHFTLRPHKSESENNYEQSGIHASTNLPTRRTPCGHTVDHDIEFGANWQRTVACTVSIVSRRYPDQREAYGHRTHTLLGPDLVHIIVS